MKGFTTKALHTGYEANQSDGAVIPPLHLSTTFEHGNDGGYEYSRSGNPTRGALESALAALDGNDYGLAFSSGSAALAAVVSLLKPDESIILSSDVYGGTYRYVVNVAGKQNLRYRIVDFGDARSVESTLKTSKPRFVWLETPTNPLLKVTDIEWLANLSHTHNAQLIVDNTFASPILQQPAKYGADAVVYSTTKYINGHSDSIGGSITTSDEELFKLLKFVQNAAGTMLSPFDGWLTLRGLKTLELRMQRHTQNADAVVGLLTKHPGVSKVFYPGFNSKSQAAIVQKQMSHPGAMVSFELAESANPLKFIEALKLIPLAESLGGVESLLDHPASMTHASLPKAERKKIGLSDSLFRLSVGIENSEDIVEDIARALVAAQYAPKSPNRQLAAN